MASNLEKLEERIAVLETEIRLARTFTRAVFSWVAQQGALSQDDLKAFRYLFVLDGGDPVAVEYLKWLDGLLQEAEQTRSNEPSLQIVLLSEKSPP